TFDWSLIKSVNRPYFLAGGLTPENVGKAIEELDPFAVDASSSLETDGRKDRQKIKAFIDEVRKERNYE
ncbi:MAG: phosphoribosylanthranilate isomerase, partial [Lachnospiraceae bacterium]|nr:phosphoribosylanthranilate isomerase [Lachnospiraceae bacterium]